MGVINVLDLFLTNDNLIMKSQVNRGISDHDAVFVEGINIKTTLNKQKCQKWLPFIEKQTEMP